MNILDSEQEEQIEKGLQEVCDVLHTRYQEGKWDVLTCRVFQCDKCPFNDIDSFTDWMKEQDKKH